MVKILSSHSRGGSSFEDKKAGKESLVKELWESFRSQDRFTKFFIVFIILFISAVPVIVSQYFDIRQRAAFPLLSEKVVYDDALPKPGFWWNEWAAPTHPALVTMQYSAQKASGSYSMEFNPNDWTIAWFYASDRANNCDTAPNACGMTTFAAGDYTDLEFDIYGFSPFLSKFNVNLAFNPWSTTGNTVNIIGTGEGKISSLSSSWQHVKIPMKDFGVGPSAQITGFSIHLREPNSGGFGNILLDNVRFTKYDYPAPTLAPSQPFSVNIDANADNHPISPLIYGLSTSGGSQPYYKDMGVSLVRWGGNARTRFNWEINSSNAGSDWYFQNQAKNKPTDFVNSNKSVGAESLLTIPMIGWVAKDGNSSTASTGAPANGGPAVSPGSSIAKLCDGSTYDPTANRNTTSLPSFAKKNAPFSLTPDTTDGKVYQDEWVNSLKTTLGPANSGGVKFYAMDNEMDLWESTHVDVHPVRPGYDDTLSLFTEYAKAVKAVDPKAQVTAPVGWGWLSLWYTALDVACDGSWGQDKKLHGDMPFYQWFLQKAKEHDTTVGYRTLDVLDTHFGPQPRDKSEASLLREQRSWWDPIYQEQGWMGDSAGEPLRVLPRLQEWISQYYPGTKIGITEWYEMNGKEDMMIGALLAGEDLGIFGREDVYLATYWGQPADRSPVYWAWRMFRNYDGAYSKFGDVNTKAIVNSADIDKISVYSSKDSQTGKLKLMVINKMPLIPADISLNISNFSQNGTVKIFEYSNSDLSQIKPLADKNLTNGVLSATVSPYSITLLEVSPSSGSGSASIQASPQTGAFNNGDTFTVDLKIDGGGTAFNAAEANVSVSSNLKINNLTITPQASGGCNFVWANTANTPTASNPSFAGAILKDSSLGCTVYTLTLEAVSGGTGTVSVANGSVKSYSTNEEILGTLAGGSYALAGPTPIATATLTPTSTPTNTPTPTSTPIPTFTPTPTPPSGTIVPTIALSAPSINVQKTSTYKALITLSGTKSNDLSIIFVNDSSSSIIYPSSTTWSIELNLARGVNTFNIYGKNAAGSQSPTASISITNHRLSDINGDGRVDLTDLSMFGTDYGKSQNLNYELSDMNEDAGINLTDFSIIAKQYDGI